MAWKKILLEGDAAELSDTAPGTIGESDTPSAGVATEASRRDHVHGSPASWTPAAHNLGGAEHGADTLANLNAKVSDATLDDSSATRDPNAHATSHKSGGADAIKLNEFAAPDGAVAFAQQQVQRAVIHPTDTPPDSGTEAEAQVYFDTGVGDKHLYVWVP